MNKPIGYILILLGILLAGVKFAFKEVAAKIPFISTLNDMTTIIIITIAVLIGFFILKPSKQQGSSEVPIYHGKKIIGYRKR